jgi:hypothetical protein
MKIKYQLTPLLILTITSPLCALASEYPKGHRALEIFDAEGMEATPTAVMIWIGVATACFVAGLLFVRRHSIARWVTGCYIAGFMALVFSSVFNMVQLQLGGFLSLVHIIFWTPALYQLLIKRPFLSKEVTPFSVWSGVITVIIFISYYFDIPYAFIFLRHVIFDL